MTLLSGASTFIPNDRAFGRLFICYKGQIFMIGGIQ